MYVDLYLANGFYSHALFTTCQSIQASTVYTYIVSLVARIRVRT